MALVAKRNPYMAPLKNQQGQISIFFSASLLVLISIIAFVINIGLFVKAKINLQNATDAAAFSGAAVQSRQLTKIAYLNWEMRNIFKEWMYKYYVVGNLNIQDVQDPSGSGAMNFRLEKDINVLDPARSKDDSYNIPSVCIHIATSQTNICKRYAVPGLPEFGSSNLVGAEEASRVFMDTLISTKVNDCIDRSRLNMLVANTWAYNVLGQSFDDSLSGRGPAILADRQGAWPKAVELAIRIRNLEYIMNRPAQTQGVCNDGSTSGGLTSCNSSITSIMQERKMGNERIVKAFYSGFRNLGNASEPEMKNSFTLTEIPPTAVPFTKKTDASYLLIPDGKVTEKQWVDLKLQMVNYATFYTALIPRSESDTSGACDISKVAIPVPGYPMGFYKNPDVLTYYAVRGEAEFTGMFNPFREGVVKLTAYSAAKPMGGRIGPMLFLQKPNSDYFVGRDDPKRRSQPYITSFDFVGTPKRNGAPLALGEFEPGIPLPINTSGNPGSFWLETDSSPIGGLVADAAGIQFGLPNLVYDYEVPFQNTGYTSSGANVHKIFSKDPISEDLAIGLFSKFQFSSFKGAALSNVVTPETLDHEIARVRAPTLYEAANYLVPTPNDFNILSRLDSFGFIEGQKEELPNGIIRYQSDIYAPLYGEGSDQTDILFDNAASVTTAIFEFMNNQSSAMDKYRMSLNKAAYTIYSQKFNLAPGAEGAAPGFEKAAKGVSDIDFENFDIDDIPNSCQSIAGQFLYFYKEGAVSGGSVVTPDPSCPTPLGKLISEYFNRATQDPTFRPLYYRFSFSWPKNFNAGEGKNMLTAYAPGRFTGVSNDAVFNTPIPGSAIQGEVMRRNFYSTKFVNLDSLRSGGGYVEQISNFNIYSEGAVDQGEQGQRQGSFKNALNPEAVNAQIDTIKY